MTGSWTDDEDQLKRDRGIDEGLVTGTYNPGRSGEREGTAPGAPLRFYPEANVSADTERREQLRAEEIERMERLAARIEQGIEEGLVDLESATTMLLNVSRARAALGGVGSYPGAF